MDSSGAVHGWLIGAFMTEAEKEAGGAARKQRRPVVQNEFQSGPVQAPAEGRDLEKDMAEPGSTGLGGGDPIVRHVHHLRGAAIRRSIPTDNNLADKP